MVQLVGKFDIRIYRLTHIIASTKETLYNVTVLVGSNQSTQVPIYSLVAEIEYAEYALSQEVISQEALEEIERRLEEVIGSVARWDTTELDDKIKILAGVIKLRYTDVRGG